MFKKSYKFLCMLYDLEEFHTQENVSKSEQNIFSYDIVEQCMKIEKT